MKEKLADAKEEMDSLELPVYTLSTRREAAGSDGYKIYDSISTIIDALANVFPIFLYFVAALVTLTTMTRFVDEERMNAGTLKALGYTDRDVMKKVYGLWTDCRRVRHACRYPLRSSAAAGNHLQCLRKRL